VANALSTTLSFDGPPNLSMGARGFYLVAGLGLAASGAMPRPNPLLNILAIAAGSYMAWSGYTGRCPAKAALLDANAAPGRLRGRA
jgi:hypothetical protein